jgi:hypothetical protein
MVSESICLEILLFARGKTLTVTMNWDASAPGNETSSTNEDAFTESALYRHLLPRYPMAEIDAAMRWLEYGQYVGGASARYMASPVKRKYW